MRGIIKKYTVILCAGLFLNSCSNKETVSIVSEVNIIPKPAFITPMKGSFRIENGTTFSSSENFHFSNKLFADPIRKVANIKLKGSNDRENAAIVFKLDSTLPAEGYRLKVSQERILLEGGDKAGIYYGAQTLRQMLPPELESDKSAPVDAIEIPYVEINDFPRFRYRGMHLDVARHFFSKEFIKEYISHLAMLKMNYFHWHLTEDQGWRIEIDQFPRLTTHAAYRDETLIGHYNDIPQTFDGQRYGGFYSKEDIREIVAFATDHHVTIIPEIEMPGHAQAAISAYPELGCSGEQVQVATKWGVFENIYCPNQKTFAFLKGVLTEVMDLFPGEYIHIGGDEAPKKQWEQCAHCQKLIRDLNLKDEHELQSWFIKEIETFLNDNGKKMIGWDEILEGGIAPNATVMSWRGTQGGIEAAKSGHNVIMTPTSHAYFDYYQSENPSEPLAIGGFLPLEKVYSFNPVPSELNVEEAKYILGAQGNVWTEYMKTEEQVEYMIFPRILAMGEVVWAGPSENLEEEYPDFASRVENFHDRLQALNVNYANHLYAVNGQVEKTGNSVYYILQTPTTNKEIRYSLNGKAWQSYESRIPVLGDTELKALVFDKGRKLSDTLTESIKYHKGILSEITLNVEPHPSYAAGGKEALINGIYGSDSRFGDSEWLGFWGEDLTIDVTFKDPVIIDQVLLRFFHAPGQWIYSPKKVILNAETLNGNVMKVDAFLDTSAESMTIKSILRLQDEFSTFKIDKIKKIEVVISNYGLIPEGKQGAGNKAWTFIDEIIIE
jgi:hexosaminidase